MRVKIIKTLNLWLPVIIWAAIIFQLSNHKLSAASPEYWKDFAFKKGAHLFFYGSLSILLYRALRGEGVEKLKSVYVAIIISFVYGISDEIHQSFISGREPTIRDVFIDTAGATFASFLLYYLLPKLPKKAQKLLGSFGLK